MSRLQIELSGRGDRSTRSKPKISLHTASTAPASRSVLTGSTNMTESNGFSIAVDRSGRRSATNNDTGRVIVTRNEANSKPSFTVRRDASSNQRMVVTARDKASSSSSSSASGRIVVNRSSGGDTSTMSDSSPSSSSGRQIVVTTNRVGGVKRRIDERDRSEQSSSSQWQPSLSSIQAGSTMSRGARVRQASADANEDKAGTPSKRLRSSVVVRDSGVRVSFSGSTSSLSMSPPLSSSSPSLNISSTPAAAVPTSTSTPAPIPQVRFSADLAERITRAGIQRASKQATQKPKTNQPAPTPLPLPQPTLTALAAKAAKSGSATDASVPLTLPFSPVPSPSSAISPSPSPSSSSSSSATTPTVVLLRNLAPSVTPKFLLTHLFGLYRVRSLRLDRDPSTGLCRGTAEAMMDSAAEADEFVRLNQGRQIMGKQVMISIIAVEESEETAMEQPSEPTQMQMEDTNGSTPQRAATSSPVPPPFRPGFSDVDTSHPPSVSASASSTFTVPPTSSRPFNSIPLSASTARALRQQTPLSISNINLGFQLAEDVWKKDSNAVSDSARDRTTTMDMDTEDTSTAQQPPWMIGLDTDDGETIFNITNTHGIGLAASPPPSSSTATSATPSTSTSSSRKPLDVRPKSVVLSGSASASASATRHNASNPSSSKPSITLSKRSNPPPSPPLPQHPHPSHSQHSSRPYYEESAYNMDYNWQAAPQTQPRKTVVLPSRR